MKNIHFHETLLFCTIAIMTLGVLAPDPGHFSAAAQSAPQTASGPTVSVTSYGADPSGSRDSTQAFVNAIKTGRSVYVPAGIYQIDNHDLLVLTAPGQKLFGDGRTGSVLNYMGPCASDIQAYFSVITLQGPYETISDLEITSRLSTKCRMTGIRLNSTHGLVDDVAVTEMWHHGIYLKGSYNTVLDSDMEYDYYGIAGDHCDHQLVRANYVSNHYSTSGEQRPWTQKSMYWDGIAFEGLTNSIIDDNIVEDNGQSGIYEGGNHSVSYGNVIVDNIVRHNRNEGIDQGVTGVSNPGTNYVGHLVISGNTTVDNWRHDIWLNEIDGAVVAWNNAAKTTDYPKWWSGDIGGPGFTPDVCAVMHVVPASVVRNVIFVDNTCSQYNQSRRALDFETGSGTGNILQNNEIIGPTFLGPMATRPGNAISTEPPSSQQH